MWAMMGREAVTGFLIDRGARPDLFMAAVLNDVALAERILDDEPDAIDVRLRHGQPSHEHLGHGDKYIWALDGAEMPVEVARRRGHTEVYDVLLARSSPFVRLLQAARRGDVESVVATLRDDQRLLSGLTDDEVCDLLSGTAGASRVLLARGLDPNARDDVNGATALHRAAWQGDRELVELLLAHGADPTLLDRTHSGTAIGWAHVAGHAHVVEALTRARS